MRFTNIEVTKNGFRGTQRIKNIRAGLDFSAEFPRFLIREAWDRGLDIEDLADGYGVGMGTHGDWSGIRDSSDNAINKMLERALNFLFPT